MSTKAELMGCEYETGMCEHYLPGDGKVINGVMHYPGLANNPTQGGRCLKDSRMIRRMDACPISGKSAKKLTKAEQWGCLKCENYQTKDRSVPTCQLAGEYAAINALHECPKTKQQGPTKEELAQKKIEGFQCEGCRFYAHDSASDFYEAACMRVFGRIAGLSECPGCEPKSNRLTERERDEEELAIRKNEKKNIEQFGCEGCTCFRIEKEKNDAICDKLPSLTISDLCVCPGRQEKPQETQEKSAVPEGKERWDYRTLPGDVQAVDYWYDVGRKTLFETTCGTLGECRKARDQFFEAQAREASRAQIRIGQFGCEGCGSHNDSPAGHICLRRWSKIADLKECPGRKEPEQPVQELEQTAEAPKEESAPIPTAPSASQMRILALDVSTKCTGWAIREGDKIVEHGSIKATGDDTEKRKEIMRQGVINYCLNETLNCVLMERSFIMHNDPSRITCEMQGILKNLIHRVGFKLLEPSPTTWRSICPGSGRCDKDAAIEYVALQDITFESADEAEAICMALSFSDKLVKILDAEKEKKKNGKSKSKEGSNGNNGSNGGKRGRASAGTAIPACATKAS